MTVRALLVFGGICVAWLHSADAQASCAAAVPCLRFEEGACIGGSRTVCLQPNTANTACDFGTLCSIVGGTASNIVVNQRTCGVFAGGSTATFAVSDEAVDASGTVSGASVLLVGSAASRTGSCTSPGTRLCSGATFNNQIWTFAVNSCSCTCGTWSNWGSCSASCTRSRSRSCTAPTNDISCASQMTETSTCTGDSCLGCSCEPSWSQWSACSTTCQGGQRTKTRRCTATLPGATCENIVERLPCPSSASCADPRFRCHCGGWTGWSSCSSSCSTGSQSRTRSCEPIAGGPPNGTCPASVFPLAMTASCMGKSKRCPVTITPSTGCSCSAWRHTGVCSVTCGTGLQQRVRDCSSACHAGVNRIDSVPCVTGVVCGSGSGGGSGGGSSGGCLCGSWQQNNCSKPCGGGENIETRTCSGGCGPDELESRYSPCNTLPCDGSRGDRSRGGDIRGRGDRGRGGRRRGSHRNGRRNCNRNRRSKRCQHF